MPYGHHDHTDHDAHDHGAHDHAGHGAHDHGDHDHGDHPASATRRALTWALALNGGFLIVEVVVGVLTNSLALLSDAGHMVGDVAALLVALAALSIASASASAQRSFGWVRAEVLGGFINALALLGICGWIFYEAIERMRHGPPDVPPIPILVVGTLGLLINLGSAWNLARGDRDNINIRGALAHMLADALGSVGAMCAAGFIWLGFPVADPIISILTALLILWGTYGLLRDSTRVLLQFAPAHFDASAVTQALSELEHVQDVHHVHAWSLDGQRVILTLHVVISDECEEQAMRQQAMELLSGSFDLDHVTMQIERPHEAGDQCACTALTRSVSAHGHHHHHHHGHAH